MCYAQREWDIIYLFIINIIMFIITNIIIVILFKLIILLVVAALNDKRYEQVEQDLRVS